MEQNYCKRNKRTHRVNFSTGVYQYEIKPPIIHKQELKPHKKFKKKSQKNIDSPKRYKATPIAITKDASKNR